MKTFVGLLTLQYITVEITGTFKVVDAVAGQIRKRRPMGFKGLIVAPCSSLYEAFPFVTAPIGKHGHHKGNPL